ncbi:polysaccharide biosynthesis/export family protein [Mesorhizobium sp. KR2-14]|uniref:polysaccharide biosynthesis/export family protein n=1 Tax=Mesorhizobium sp. KR2-14 TaxID=3156610 RepID=UPI0032B423C6
MTSKSQPSIRFSRSFTGHFHAFRYALAGALLLASAAADLRSATAAEYLLGPQDKLRLKIYEWRASRDVIFEWTALNDQFVVGANGSLFLPFIGEVRAEGVAPGDLAREIGERLMRHMGLGRQPDVAVEVVQFRPFYIVGHVTQSGEFPYRPGMTVLQAVGIAGGLRTREESIARLEREVIAGRGEVSVLALTNISLQVRKARLEAEAKGEDSITFPPALSGRSADGTVKLMMEQEQAVFKARRQGRDTQLRSLAQLRDFLEKEIVTLQAQLAFSDKQIELVQKELRGVSTLVKEGLAAAPREMLLERTLAQIQSERLSTETSLLRARQEISRTEISALELRNHYDNEVAEALRETQGLLNEIASKGDTAVQLLHESEISAPRLLASRAAAARAQPTYSIIRRSEGGETRQIAATETTEVEPGDTIKVEMPLPTSLEDTDISRSGWSALTSSEENLPKEQSGTN